MHANICLKDGDDPIACSLPSLKYMEREVISASKINKIGYDLQCSPISKKKIL